MSVDIQKNREILNKMIKENNISEETQKLYRDDLNWFINNHVECKYEDNLEQNCHQQNKGFMDSLDYENNRFYRTLKPCAHLLFQQNKNKYVKQFLFVDFNPLEFNNIFSTSSLNENIDLFLNDYDNIKSTIQKLGIDEIEFDVKSMITNFFVTRLKQNKLPKGFYLYGPMGVGKTTLFRMLAMYAANNYEKTIAFTNVANLANKLKEGFSNNSNENIISKLQIADLLFLDDIGGETATEWLRDDVLYNVLNFRMMNNKPTFFTSNMNIAELSKHYELSKTRQRTLVTKAQRLIERVNVLAKELSLPGKDHRIKN